jgi:hypothetical protein
MEKLGSGAAVVLGIVTIIFLKASFRLFLSKSIKICRQLVNNN